MEKMYSLIESAEILGVKVRTLREWLKNGTIKGHRYADKPKWYIPQSEIDRLQCKAVEEK